MQTTAKDTAPYYNLVQTEKKSGYKWATTLLLALCVSVELFALFDPTFTPQVKWMITAAALLTALFWSDYFVMKYRMKKGLYGNNSWEAFEAIYYIRGDHRK
jgi:hypothetical protein